MADAEHNSYTPGDKNRWDDTVDYHFTSYDQVATDAGSMATSAEATLDLLADDGQRIVERSYGEQGHLE